MLFQSMDVSLKQSTPNTEMALLRLHQQVEEAPKRGQ